MLEFSDAISASGLLQNPENYQLVLEKVEKEMIKAVIENTNSLQEAFEFIGVSRSTLDNKRKKYQL